MTATVLPFGPVEHFRRVKELEAQLGQAHEALLRAQDAILALQDEKKYREFYQWLATERLKDIMDLERALHGEG
jgi:hypothetical protein